jgi:peptidoglycan biosynthesis protein MviN/MurJ (putative lipid II flippase)
MMNTISVYSVALFLHIVGALGLFVALGLEWTSLLYLRRAATADQAREWLKLFTSLRRLYPISWLAILIPGFYMTATVWGGTAWIIIALAAVVLIAVLGAALGGRQMAPIGQAVAGESGPLSATLRNRLDNPLLWASLRIRTAIALGVVFLMTVKPDLLGALITMGVAVFLGLAFSLPARGRDREKLRTKQAGDSL